jgi:DNA-directed RNA polymerase specialized sigma24 family protein
MAEPGDNYLDTIRRGDAKGLREIYAKYLPRIARFIQMNGGSAEDAKDIFRKPSSASTARANLRTF